MNSPKLILASGSPRRKELMRLLDMPFDVVTSNAPEASPAQLTPVEACQLNAYRKARVVAKRFPDSIVIGADTEVSLNQKLFGKPRDLREANSMLRRLQGKTHFVITGVCIVFLRKHQQQCFAEMTDVKFHKLTAEQRMEYLKSINPLDKAGAYAIQENGHMIVEEIEGSFSNVVGLPVELLKQELSRFI